MRSSLNWQITVLKGLKAHFRQPDGSSELGTDWAVALTQGAQEHRILVRAYTDDFASIGQDGEAKIVVEFVAGLLDQGWTPDKWGGQPGELTVPRKQGATGTRPAKSWWRFW